MFIKEIEKSSLLRPLQVITGVVEKKQSLPILSNVLIEKIPKAIKLTATDLEIQISNTVNVEYINDEFESVTVNGKKIYEILKILPDQSKVSIELRENKAIIKSGKSKFSLQTLPVEDFPKLNSELNESKKISIKQSELKNLLLSVQYSMAQQDVRYYLNGVLLVFGNSLIKTVATDGHRLAFNSCSIEGKFETEQEIILPRKAVLELSKLLNDTNDIIELEISNQQIKVAFSNTVLMSKIIDGKFPDYERVIPKYSNHLILNRATIQQALQRAAILSNEKFRGIRFILTERNLSIVSSNSEQEEAQEDIETDYHGEPLDIGFNVNYLMDGLNNISGESVSFSFGDPNSSILITTKDNSEFRYVVMPMRI